MSEIIQLKDFSDDIIRTPEESLRELLDKYENNGFALKPDKMLVLLLDKGESGSEWNITIRGANIVNSEGVALLETAKVSLLSMMGYPNGD